VYSRALKAEEQAKTKHFTNLRGPKRDGNMLTLNSSSQKRVQAACMRFYVKKKGGK
jgi:hypothetical protein